MIGIDIRFMTRDMQDGIISSGVGLFCAEVLSGMKETDRKGIVLIVNADQRKTAGKTAVIFARSDSMESAGVDISGKCREI